MIAGLTRGAGARVSDAPSVIGSPVCRTAVEKWEAVIAHRPNHQPSSQRALTLNNPGCAHACRTCFMECAIAEARLAWWRNELAKAEAFEGGMALHYGSSVFLEPAGRA